MNRRRIMTAMFGTGVLATASSPAMAAAVAPTLPSAVYHLGDVDKVAVVLGNMRNHITGMGGPPL